MKVERCLKELFGSEMSRLYIIENEKIKFYSIEDNAWQYFPKDCGVISETFLKSKILCVKDCYNHPKFNDKIDLATTLPILCRSGFNSKTNNPVIGIEIINQKGIAGRSVFNRSSLDIVDEEILECFTKYITVKYLYLSEYLILIKKDEK